MSEDRRMNAPTDGKRLVLVEWVVSRGAHGNWVELEDLAQIGTCTMQSVGWVIAQDGERLHLVPHVCTDPAQGCGDMVIPKLVRTRVGREVLAAERKVKPSQLRWLSA